MMLDTVTTAAIDRAIGRQAQLQFDRERFAYVCGESKEFIEYIEMLTGELLLGKTAIQAALASAITLGIEIGIALREQ